MASVCLVVQSSKDELVGMKAPVEMLDLRRRSQCRELHKERCCAHLCAADVCRSQLEQNQDAMANTQYLDILRTPQQAQFAHSESPEKNQSIIHN